MLNWTIDKCIFFGISCENLTKGKKKTEIKTQTNKWKSHSVRVHCFEPCTKYCRPAKGISQITTTTTHTEKREEKINGTENNLFLYYIWCSFLVVHFFSILSLSQFVLFFNFCFVCVPFWLDSCWCCNTAAFWCSAQWVSKRIFSLGFRST